MFGQPREDMRVADYVLGLMDAEEARFFERELLRNPELAARVDDWRERVARLENGEPDTPHAELRRRIEAGMRRRGIAPATPPGPARQRLAVASQDLPGLMAVGTGFFVAGILLGGLVAWLLFVR